MINYLKEIPLEGRPREYLLNLKIIISLKRLSTSKPKNHSTLDKGKNDNFAIILYFTP